MRVIIGGSSLAVLLALIIVIHTSVINKSVREDEINRGLENATDYAIDVCSSYYRYIQADDNDDTYITRLMEFFCMTLNSAVKTEGDITVSLAEADVDDGRFDFLVKQEYTYSFGQKKGVCVCQRAVLLKK
ncbi:MAG: hypothetical protein KH121_02365 [Eubacterium sp.]|jgi:hypothetical protein|nr:hypothetical protein [Eubacterium sp.]